LSQLLQQVPEPPNKIIVRNDINDAFVFSAHELKIVTLSGR